MLGFFMLSLTPHILCSELLGLVPYLDWFVIAVTVATCIVMILQEKASYARVNDPFRSDQLLMVTECIFFGSMAFELFLKVNKL